MHAPARCTASYPVDLICEVLGSLSPVQRRIFVLSEVEGRASSDIARELGSWLWLVRMRLHFARAAFYGRVSRDVRFSMVAS